MMAEPWRDKPHIVVVDDDDRLRALLTRYLGEHGFMVTAASSAQEAEALCGWFEPDMVVLDVMMPGETGTQWLARAGLRSPVLMLSALSEAHDRIAGLEVGAEDYLAKPFEPKELVLRIRSILRRTGGQKERHRWIGFGDYRFDAATGKLLRGEQSISLTVSEIELLRMLVTQAPKPVSREALSRLLPEGSNERSVDVQMSRLRKKIEAGDTRPTYIRTIRGAGYALYVD